ncbi:flagellar export protein FliJ [Vibrio caribbeanicus]|jgi:flagellar FliJ protein|uniref:Flagellar FliJ protein n=1 Tax=Vibrio caribbeanicus ATCC BAA-2122 TaxID=796620 RepID=E3BPM9_9VIBR|nr:flagellar export protein FliJ [Vibrio caribbeanicus]EFP94947.1 flagellar biosynthesis chaperone [Vibrio caribbeanicus ATCC BAA-2122]|tara:strand:+ start:832 stop:1281 length:450 start_codon:yes stop_codon:yes gene_type:complete
MESALGILLEQAQEREDQAVLALNNARVELDDYYRQLQQIEQYRLDYCQQLVQRGQQGLAASEYMHLNRFLTTLDETLAKQKQAEEHFKSQVEHCEQNWSETRKTRRSYELLIEKKQKQRQRLEERLEQKQMDEFCTLSFSRQRGSDFL